MTQAIYGTLRTAVVRAIDTWMGETFTGRDIAAGVARRGFKFHSAMATVRLLACENWLEIVSDGHRFVYTKSEAWPPADKH